MLPDAYTAGVPHRDPFVAATRLVVDGSNVRGATRRAGGDLPEMALVSRLTAVVGPRARIVVVFDGARQPNVIVPGRSGRLEVRWSRHEKADDLIVRIVAAAPDGTIVVTDDVELRSRVRMLGADSIPARALVERFGRQHAAAPTPERARPASSSPPGRPPGDDGPDEPERPAWKPGRGATRKRGNPRRGRPAR